MMKKILSLVMGMGLAFSLGMAYAEDMPGRAEHPGEKMIHDDDLQRLQLDQDRATINQMPAEGGSEGSAPGGVTTEPESTGTDIEPGKAPVEEEQAKPAEEESGSGGEGKVLERFEY